MTCGSLWLQKVHDAAKVLTAAAETKLGFGSWVS